MGFRFRKTYRSGPFRLNLSKTGIGWSAGIPGFRWTARADGKRQTTWNIPGSGISYVKTTGRTSQPTHEKVLTGISIAGFLTGMFVFLAGHWLAALVIVWPSAICLIAGIRPDVKPTDAKNADEEFYREVARAEGRDEEEFVTTVRRTEEEWAAVAGDPRRREAAAKTVNAFLAKEENCWGLWDWLATMDSIGEGELLVALEDRYGFDTMTAICLLKALEKNKWVGPRDDNGRRTVLIPKATPRNATEDDPLYEDLVDWIASFAHISASDIQRRYQISFPHAMCLVERLEKDGRISPMGPDGRRTVYPSSTRRTTPQAPSPPPTPDPWAVLNLSRTSTRDECQTAFRQMIAQYHPDKVAHLGPELQTVAAQKTRDILHAYDAIKQQQRWT